MSFSFSFAAALRGLYRVILIAFLVTAAAPLAQAGTPAAPSAVSTAPLFAGLTDYVIGNRSRMIQATCIGFGLGILILVTASRKH